MNMRIIERILFETRGTPRKSKVAFTSKFENSEVEELEEKGLITVEGELLRVNHDQRLELVEEALRLHGDPEVLSKNLNWREFEDLTVKALTESDYRTYRGLVFTTSSTKYQIDVVGIRGEIILCIDCKHWRPGCPPSRMRKAIEKQSYRTKTLSQTLESHTNKLGLLKDNAYHLLPCLVILHDIGPLIFERTPVIPIFRLRDFLHRQPPLGDLNIRYYSSGYIHPK